MNNTIEINIQANNAMELASKKEAIEKIAKLDAGTLEKLSTVASSSKAVEKFNKQWFLIKSMFL